MFYLVLRYSKYSLSYQMGKFSAIEKVHILSNWAGKVHGWIMNDFALKGANKFRINFGSLCYFQFS